MNCIGGAFSYLYEVALCFAAASSSVIGEIFERCMSLFKSSQQAEPKPFSERSVSGSSESTDCSFSVISAQAERVLPSPRPLTPTPQEKDSMSTDTEASWQDLLELEPEDSMQESHAIYSRLNRAIDEGKEDEVKSLLMTVLDEERGTTLLHGLALSGDVAMMDKIGGVLDEFLQTKDNEGRTLLHYAAQGGGVDMVNMLVVKGLNPLEEDEEGKTAIEYALRGVNKACGAWAISYPQIAKETAAYPEGLGLLGRFRVRFGDGRR